MSTIADIARQLRGAAGATAKPAKPRGKWFSVGWLATIIIIVFAFCFWINVPEWHGSLLPHRTGHFGPDKLMPKLLKGGARTSTGSPTAL
jgi:hypothetical protein